VLPGCARSVSAPIATIKRPLDPSRPCDRLLVMLPGVMDRATVFYEHGFFQDLCEAEIVADVRFVETRLRHYSRREIVDRMCYDVLEPARLAGYRDIWLVGVSIGGFAALSTAKEHPRLVDGLVVLSPFLGRMATTGAIRRAGGLRTWTPPTRERRDFSGGLWHWLQGYAHGDDRPPLYLAYGSRENDIYWGYSLLADVLPCERVVTHDGRHGWKTWKPMWPGLIAQVWGSDQNET
jgi:pimeloyl-ACP methyl ester carboxylesterase